MGALSVRSASRLMEVSASSLFFLSLWSTLWAEAEGQSVSIPHLDRIVEQSRPALVKVIAQGDLGYAIASGFFIDPRGSIVTSHSAVYSSQKVEVEYRQKKVPAQILFSDPRTGLAMLKVKERPTPFLPKAPPDKMQVADPVVALGISRREAGHPIAGRIVGFDRQTNNRVLPTTHVRVHLDAQWGFGGAPLLDQKGRVTGVLLCRLSDKKACYALPIAAVEKVERDFLLYGEVRHSRLGMRLDMNSSTPKVVEVIPGESAHRAGLRSGDVLIQIGDHQVRTSEEVVDGVFYLSAGHPTEIHFLRGSTVMKRIIVPAQWKSAEGEGSNDMQSSTSSARGLRPVSIEPVP